MKSAIDHASATSATDGAQRQRASNRRIAWTLSSIAAVFFAGIIATRWVGGGTVGIAVLGAAIMLFLVIAIGRNLFGADQRDGPDANGASARRTTHMDAQPRDISGEAREARR